MRSTELLTYERGDKYAKTYKVSGVVLVAAPEGALQITTEPINAIGGGYRRPFQQGVRGFRRATNRGGGN